MKQTFISILFLVASLPLWADDDFTVLDWQEMRIDSILPMYNEVVPLESDFRQYDYRVTVQYPEWQVLNAREQAVARRYADQLDSTLQIHSHVGVSRKVGVLDISFCPIIRQGNVYKKLLGGKIVITPVPKAQHVRSKATSVSVADRYTRNSKLSTGKWVKISVTKDGIYSLTRSALKKMGFANPDKVHLYGYGGYRLSEVSEPAREYDDLTEVPLYKRGNDFLFWANGLVCWEGNTRIFNPYATSASYFLTEEEGDNTPVIEQSLTTEPDATYNTFTDHVLHEKDEYAWFHGGRNLFENVDFATAGSRTYRLTAQAYAGDAKLTVSFTAASDNPTTVTPSVNGTALASFNISGLGEYIYGVAGTRTYNVANYANGTNNWTVKLSSTSGHPARLDYLALHYTRYIGITTDGHVAFSQNKKGSARFNVWGNQMAIMRIPSATRPGAVIQGTQSDTAYSVVVDDATARYVAFQTQYQFPEPTFVGLVENQNLHAMDSLDMVIIIPQSGKLHAQAQRLADAHALHDGLRVAVVRADQLYNEFSSGTPDATAYRRFMKMLYDRAKTDDDAPKYLLLMGDCAWDNRMLSTAWRNYRPEDYLLCFESENSFSDIKCYVMEDYFGLLDDGEGSNLTGDKVDLGIGRFPVTSEAEAKLMVDKSIAHMQNTYAGSWKNVVSVIADDGDNNLHLRDADEVANHIIATNPEMEVRKVMLDAYARVSTPTHNSYPAVNELIHKQMEEGALVMNYVGHAAAYSMSHEFVLLLDDFVKFKGNHLPLWVAAACDVMPFDGQQANIGETAVLNTNGAAVAFYSTTRTVFTNYNKVMNKWFMYYLFASDAEGRRYTVGDAVRLAKTYLIANGLESKDVENKLHYALLGDPALRFGAPTNHVVLDSINGQSLSEAIQLKAGQQVRLSGHVQDAQGALLSGMSGILSTRVYDNLETVTCLNNAGANNAFVFTDRNKILFNGQDSLVNGRFQISYIMPRDINFSNQSGRMVFYAISNDRTAEANGYCEQFTVGDVAENGDTIGPQIQMYLNSENFENGGKVNSTPCFFAHLTDDSGISYSGSGLGHNLLLTIDNDPEATYTLNDYYQAEFGGYTRGSLAFPIPPLSDGKHTLQFRAWDVLNNTSAQTLDFVVDNSLKPNLLNVIATQSPAINATNFLVSHDRAGSAVDIHLEVFDFSGQRMYSHHESSVSATGLATIPWNLCTNSGGRLGAGIYLYRVTLSCNGSKEVSKTQKIIIAGNKKGA